MTDKDIPLTMYNVRQNKPDHPFGTPAVVLLNDATGSDEKWGLARGSMKAIPDDATVQSTKLRVFCAKAYVGSVTVSAAPNTEAWGSKVHWSNRPNPPGATIGSATIVDPQVGDLFEIDVTAWSATRDTLGLVLRVSVDANFALAGSSAADFRPYLAVTYVVLPDPPGNLQPQGGAVSVAKPDLTFDGPDDMSAYQIQFSTDGGTTVAFDTGVKSGTVGYYVQEAGAPTPAVDSTTISWRAKVTNPAGTSAYSGWASYTYHPLPAVDITNPVAGSDQIDGTPPETWTVTGTQTAWKSEYADRATGRRVDDSGGWADEGATRTWTPGTGVKVPGGLGRYRLFVRDDSVVRAGGANAPTQVELTVDFQTVESSAVSGITGLAVSIVGGHPVLTGTRGAGTPDTVSLLRDGVRVPLWDDEGDPVYQAPGADFFVGDDFTIPDFTSDLRRQHTWKVVTYVGGSPAGSAAVTDRPFDGGCYIIDPATGEWVEVFGLGDAPTNEMVVAENSVLHVPVTGGPVVEPVRRRLVRTTKAGTITGVAQDADAATLESWAEGPQQKRYRLVFGISNYGVILGDYSPQDSFYSEQLSAERTPFTLNWWERLDP